MDQFGVWNWSPNSFLFLQICHFKAFVYLVSLGLFNARSLNKTKAVNCSLQILSNQFFSQQKLDRNFKLDSKLYIFIQTLRMKKLVWVYYNATLN